jgi:hypothetical protein
MGGAARVRYSNVPESAEILIPEFLDFLAELDGALREPVAGVRAARAERIRRAAKDKTLPGPLPRSEANTESRRVLPLPEVLKLPGIEISGQASIVAMMIQALNPTPSRRLAGPLWQRAASDG